MHSPRLLRGLATFVALAFVASAFVVLAPTARAAASAPRWSAGDSWVYADSNGNPIRVDVIGKDPVSGVDTFRVDEAVTTGSLTVTTHFWIRDTDLGTAKNSVLVGGTPWNNTYDPPWSAADFPLSPGKTWTKTSQTRFTVGGTTISTGTFQYSGTVEAEFDVTLAAGTFHAFVIRSPTAFGYTKFYYSETAGYWVKIEYFNNNDVKTGERNLTSYRYQNANLLTYLLVGIAAIVAVLVLLFLWRMRKRAVGRPGGPAASRAPQAPAQWPQQPGYPPQQPPQP